MHRLPRQGPRPPADCRAAAVIVLAFALVGLLLCAPSAMAWTAYVAAGGSLVPIDTATDTAGTPIAAGRYLAGIAITPDGHTAYAASYFNDSLTPVDTATGVAGTPTAVGSEDVAIAPDGRTAWVVDGESIAPVAIPGGTLGTPVTVGKELRDLAISPDGSTVWVAVGQANSLVPVDIATDTAGTPIPAGPHPVALAITPDGKTAWVVDEEHTGEVVSVDLATGTLGTPITAGVYPDAIAIAPDGRTAYATSSYTEQVIPIDTATEEAETPIPVLNFPDAIAITPDGRSAYVSDDGPGAVTPIDLATRTPGAPIAVGENAAGIAIAPAQTPRASFTLGTATAGAAVGFDASASVDPGGTIASYHWDFGDGAGSSFGPTTDHVYASPGSYRVTLTVDSAGGCKGFLFTGHTAYCNGPSSASTTQTAIVAGPPPSSPGSASPAPTHASHALRVRLHCPAHAGPAGCGFRVRAVAGRAHHRSSKRPPTMLSAVATARARAGRSTLVELVPKVAYAARLEAATRILVLEKTTIRGRTATAYRRLRALG